LGLKFTAQNEDSATGLPCLRAAIERICAIAEGQQLVSFLSDHDYQLHLMPLDSPGGLLPDQKIMLLDAGQSADDMVVFLPHEAFHAVQFENCPDIRAFYSAVVSGRPADKPGTLVLPRPRDFLWAMNVMEMAAYGVQTDFVFRLAAAGGDDAPLKLYKAYSPPLAKAYDGMMRSRDVREITIAGQTCLRVPDGEKIEDDFKRDYAAATASYFWYWGTATEEGKPASLHYNDHLVRAAHNAATQKVSPLFNALAAGAVKPRLRACTSGDAVRLGRGYAVNPLDVPGFDDVSGAAYRNRISPENKQKLQVVARALRP
jgi:hypothetical protein